MAVTSRFDLIGKVALITGSSRGIGESMALDFSAAGAEVIVTGRKLQAAEAVVDKVRQSGGQATAYAYDATLQGEPEALAENIRRDLGRLDILVNNAAILRPHTVEKLSYEEFEEIFTVNTRAAVFLSKACFPLLKESEAAAVVNIAAAGAHRPLGGIGAYCASKAAIINFTNTLAREWAPTGIRVNALTPGSVATDMILPTDPERREKFEKDMAGQNLMNRLADPIEIAQAVRFLVSPAASFITGQTLVADGGYLA
ncbi:SDR family oxidoreductase [Pseudomaricurvus alkylphenolicus]|uniref:SDR family NAD(P)-dependent oxidoreductase n=1 Tax=Pseudomaricurvus alkylphenolicus TaxID=1306991 RepID=UPI0014220425|nr:SDR family oxidoreductase [Pseudomaricurvus alkylphenolicus]NIB40327.1 SDR family oxidoreductase [Pseudomaricurvus alkylphenolicus]